jgi:glycosyltransferase involved in cell wall biosynthesis
MQYKPFVSILAPCRNEAKFIENTMNSILQSDYPANRMEFLVIDGGSTDGTREIIQSIAAKDGRVKFIDNPKKIVPTAMNIAIKEAKGEYIIRIDCHSIFTKDYISKCIEVAQRTNADNVGGYGITLPGADTKTAKAIAASTSSIFGVGNSIFRLQGPEQEVDTVPFGTYRKELFEKIGYYDERLVRNQDIELNSRIRKHGGRIVISPEINLSYYNRSTYRGVWQQSFNNGLWNPYTIWLVGSGLSLRHFIPMFFVLGIFILGIAAVIWPFLWWLFGAYVLLYIGTAFFYAAKAAKGKISDTILTLWAFIVLHVAYGLGSLWAILTIPFKFPSRTKNQVGKPLADRK